MSGTINKYAGFITEQKRVEAALCGVDLNETKSTGLRDYHKKRGEADGKEGFEESEKLGDATVYRDENHHVKENEGTVDPPDALFHHRHSKNGEGPVSHGSTTLSDLNGRKAVGMKYVQRSVNRSNPHLDHSTKKAVAGIIHRHVNANHEHYEIGKHSTAGDWDD
jgi:hypothetical protein